jgi:hypothetical protein
MKTLASPGFMFYAEYFPFGIYTQVTTGASLVHFITQPASFN